VCMCVCVCVCDFGCVRARARVCVLTEARVEGCTKELLKVNDDLLENRLLAENLRHDRYDDKVFVQLSGVLIERTVAEVRAEVSEKLRKIEEQKRDLTQEKQELQAEVDSMKKLYGMNLMSMEDVITQKAGMELQRERELMRMQYELKLRAEQEKLLLANDPTYRPEHRSERRRRSPTIREQQQQRGLEGGDVDNYDNGYTEDEHGYDPDASERARATATTHFGMGYSSSGRRR